MEMPSTLKARGREAYSVAVETLTALGDDPRLSREALLRYAHACDAEQTARDAWELDGRPMHAVGSTGALVAHPIAKAVRDAEAHSLKLAASLMLTPESRAAKSVGGRPKGASQAPDRKAGLRAAA
jgi:P27 family predicted phage terminase small subunit